MARENILPKSKRNVIKPQSIKDQKIEKPNQNSKDKPMEKWYYIATYILAMIAIAGFVASMISSRNTSKAMNQLVNSLTSFVEPVIKFSGISYVENPQILNCENPPNLINYQYKNVSNIPIKVLQYEIESNYGNMPVYAKRTPRPYNHTSILEPGSNWGALTTSLDQPVREMMKNKHGIFNPPFLIVEFNGVISTLDDRKKYEVHLVHQIGVDCNSYAAGFNITTLSEDCKEIIEKE